jgi:hypothetical protein
MKIFKKIMGGFAFLGLVLSAGVGFLPNRAMAATVTSFSATLSRLKASTAANQEIKFVTPTGVASGGNFTITWSADFTMNAFDFADVDFATGSTNNCTSATFTEQSLVASGASSSQWNAALSSQTLTITSGGASATVTADRCVRIRIGTNATSGSTGDTQITNGAADDDDTIAIAGGFGDSGTTAIDIITDDQVVVTATVQPSLTFAISDNTIEFGNLSASDDTFADDSGGNATEVEAHTLSAGTNAASGYIITLNGNTLTDGLKTISAIGSSNTATSVGSEQFGVRFVASGGSGAVTAPYAAAGFAFDTAAFPDEIAASTVPSATTTYSARYIANIASNTEAGSYSATLTYVATGNF